MRGERGRDSPLETDGMICEMISDFDRRAARSMDPILNDISLRKLISFLRNRPQGLAPIIVTFRPLIGSRIIHENSPPARSVAIRTSLKRNEIHQLAQGHIEGMFRSRNCSVHKEYGDQMNPVLHDRTMLATCNSGCL